MSKENVMTVQTIDTPFGHPMAPEGPHAITTHLPGWDTAKSLRDGDKAVMSRLVSIYPRFTPFSKCREVSQDPDAKTSWLE